MTRILIIGANGMLGHVLMQWQEPGFEVAGTLRGGDTPFACLKDKHIYYGIEARSVERLGGVLKDFRPQVVINCAGLVKQRDEASDLSQLLGINAVFPHLLAGMCKHRRIRLIHISTDCVFSGGKGAPYVETDKADATDMYGQSKHMGEPDGGMSLTLRTSLIGRELSVKRGLLEWAIAQRGTTVQGYANSLYSGLTTPEMARVLAHVISSHPTLSGLYHVASEGISKYELLQRLNRAMQLDLTIEQDTTVTCDRRLDVERFFKATGYKAPAWNAMIDTLTHDVCRHE